MEKYDSTADTLKHIKRVNALLLMCCLRLINRGIDHDLSKLEDPEKSLFDEMTPKLANCTYGSDEYKQFLIDLKPALDNHYALNSHHPEHFDNGINGMDLLDVLEMLMDWKAAGERQKDGSITKSLAVNAIRFKIEPQLLEILSNTISNLGLY